VPPAHLRVSVISECPNEDGKRVTHRVDVNTISTQHAFWHDFLGKIEGKKVVGYGATLGEATECRRDAIASYRQLPAFSNDIVRGTVVLAISVRGCFDTKGVVHRPSLIYSEALIKQVVTGFQRRWVSLQWSMNCIRAHAAQFAENYSCCTFTTNERRRSAWRSSRRN